MVATTEHPPRVARYTRPMGRLLAAAALAWRPVTPLPTDVWCERELRLPAETSAAPGPVDLTERPFWREPLQLLDDPDVRTISIMGDAQGGKTVSLSAMLVSRAVCDPAPAMLVTPDQDSSRELRDKVYGMCEASPAMARRIPPLARRNDRWIDLESMVCYLAFSGSRQRLRARSCKFVFCTEVDVWQDDPRLGSSAKLIQARTKAFTEHKIVYESTPSDDASTIAALYNRSDRRKFLVPCPRCNHWQELRFFPHAKGKFAGTGGVAGLTDKQGAWLTPEQALEAAYYVGECGCRIENDAKQEMVETGMWVPRGCRVRGNKLTGTPDRPNRNAGFQISSLYAPSKSFGEVAEAYLEHREANQLRVFWNNWLGLPDRVAARMPKWRTLAQRLAVSCSHRRGTVPGEAYFLTSHADVQKDHTWNGVRAWGDKRTSWLVDWATFGRDETPAASDGHAPIASDLARLETDILAARFPIAGGSGSKNPHGYEQLAVRVLGVDANYRTFEVHDFVKHAQGQYGDRVRALRGDHKVSPTELYRMNVVERNARSGKAYEGGLQLWHICVNVFREQLVSLFSADVDQPGAWLLAADVLAWGATYLRQLVNQGPITEVAPSGKSVVRWKTRDLAVGEHAWDIEVNQLALAHMVTGGVWDARGWAKPTHTPRPASEEEAPLTPRQREDEDFSAR